VVDSQKLREFAAALRICERCCRSSEVIDLQIMRMIGTGG